jgi:hypothetical protein
VCWLGVYKTAKTDCMVGVHQHTAQLMLTTLRMLLQHTADLCCYPYVCGMVGNNVHAIGSTHSADLGWNCNSCQVRSSCSAVPVDQSCCGLTHVLLYTGVPCALDLQPQHTAP